MTKIQLQVNGEKRELPEGTTLASLLDILKLGSRPHLAVERNRKIVPKERFADTRLEEGDKLEIVSFVGGG